MKHVGAASPVYLNKWKSTRKSYETADQTSFKITISEAMKHVGAASPVYLNK